MYRFLSRIKEVTWTTSDILKGKKLLELNGTRSSFLTHSIKVFRYKRPACTKKMKLYTYGPIGPIGPIGPEKYLVIIKKNFSTVKRV